MKKKLTIITLLVMAAFKCNAQIYGGDTALEYPTMPLYDNEIMMMAIKAQAETAAKLYEAYNYYCKMADAAMYNNDWNSVITNVNYAFDTGYYCAELYLIRGIAYESLGYLKYARKDYRKAKKEGCSNAQSYLSKVNERIKNSKK